MSLFADVLLGGGVWQEFNVSYYTYTRDTPQTPTSSNTNPNTPSQSGGCCKDFPSLPLLCQYYYCPVSAPTCMLQPGVWGWRYMLITPQYLFVYISTGSDEVGNLDAKPNVSCLTEPFSFYTRVCLDMALSKKRWCHFFFFTHQSDLNDIRLEISMTVVRLFAYVAMETTVNEIWTPTQFWWGSLTFFGRLSNDCLLWICMNIWQHVFFLLLSGC